MGHEITTIEKGNVRMTYGLSTVLRRLLEEYVALQTDVDADRCYLFPHRDLPRCHATTASARSTFMRVARRAGVEGAHVHPHTTRHSVHRDRCQRGKKKSLPPAWTLYALGNSLDSVAGFVGHRNSQVTQDVYIAMSHAQRRQMVDCPWLRDVPVRGPTVQEQGRAMAEAICSPFGSADGRTFPRLDFDTRPVPPPAAPPAKRRRLLDKIVQCLRVRVVDHRHGAGGRRPLNNHFFSTLNGITAPP